MHLNEFYLKPVSECLQQMNLADLKIHTSDDGTVMAVELKYVDQKQMQKNSENQYFSEF